VECSNLLDVGCGEGYLTNLMYRQKNCQIVGIDIGEDVVRKARLSFPYISFIKGSAYELPFNDNSFDFITAFEILEHLENPETVLKEFKRVAKKWVAISVPKEPLWRILNVLRGRYLSKFGNTPGHNQHWSANEFVRFVAEYFKIIEILKPIPWIIALCEVEK